MASILKVNTIQDATNSNTAISVDSSGRVTTPAVPAFSAGLSTHAPSGDYIDNFNTPHTNVGSHFNASTGTFTAPVTGNYFFASFFMTNNTNATIGYHIRVNGSDGSQMAPYQTATGASYNQASGNCILSLSAGDEVRLYNDNAELYGGSGTGRHSNFCGYLVG
jgi:hypothetical protein